MVVLDYAAKTAVDTRRHSPTRGARRLALAVLAEPARRRLVVVIRGAADPQDPLVWVSHTVCVSHGSTYLVCVLYVWYA